MQPDGINGINHHLTNKGHDLSTATLSTITHISLLFTGSAVVVNV